MPYKNPERKRRWEREHREQRNARRRTQRLDAWSGHVRKPPFDIAAALRSARKPVTEPVSSQKPKDTWKSILGWAFGIGFVLLVVFAGASPPDSGIPGSGT